MAPDIMGGPVSDPRVYGEIHACTVSNVVESPRAMIGALMSAVNTLIDAPYGSASTTSALASRSHMWPDKAHLQ
jgi:hypothetical protein